MLRLTDAYRGLVVAALAIAVSAGWASLPLLGAAGFLLAVGTTLFNPAAMSIVPGIVSREPARLERANGRLAAAQTLGEHFAGPPLGGVLFSISRSIPFVADAVSFAVSSAPIASIPGDHKASTPGRRGSLWADIAQGLRWLAAHRLLRTLAVMVGISSLAFSAWSAIMVLFAQDQLGLGSVGYGLLWTGVAVGSLLGSLLAGRLSRLLGQHRLLLAATAVFGVTMLGIGTTSSPWTAGILLGVIGLALTVWNVIVVSLRQAITPDRLVGRVNSTFQFLSMGMLPVGAALGGTLARVIGLRAPFLISGGALLVMALAAIPVLTAHAIQSATALESRDAEDRDLQP